MDFQPKFSLPQHSKKRPKHSSPQPWKKRNNDYRSHGGLNSNNIDDPLDDKITERKEQESFAREQTRINQIQETEQMREWVAKEDDFVLKQSKKKAQIRVREGRARLIDWLAVTLSVIDKTVDPLEDDMNDSDIDIVDPAEIFEGLAHNQIQGLKKDIGTYLTLESNPGNRRYWNVKHPLVFQCSLR